MQGLANGVNGLQDMGIGTVNLFVFGPYNLTSYGVETILGGEVAYFSIHSPDWSRNSVTHEYGTPGGWDDTHGWSKWAGANGVLAFAAAKTPKIDFHVGRGLPTVEGVTGFHVKFGLDGKWYHGAGLTRADARLGHLTMLEATSPALPTFSMPIVSNQMATPLLNQGNVFSCVTSAGYSWVAGGGPLFVAPPFANQFNPK